MNKDAENEIIPDPWVALKAFTKARIALGRTGNAIPLQAHLQAQLAHAHARDAVYASLQITALSEAFKPFDLPVAVLQSKATDRLQYLTRPDLGRSLNEASVAQLSRQPRHDVDIALVLADGLCATAINLHGATLLNQLVPLLRASGFSLAPLSLVQQGRVAIGDEIGQLSGARLTVMLIGERPGLSASDSIGAYLTYAPQVGHTDERRNCISTLR